MRVPGRPTLPLTTAAPGAVGCAGRSEMWESDDPEVIMYAQGVCGVCPAQGWCSDQAKSTLDLGLSLAGVWAGQVYGGPSSYLPGRALHEVV